MLNGYLLLPLVFLLLLYLLAGLLAWHKRLSAIMAVSSIACCIQNNFLLLTIAAFASAQFKYHFYLHTKTLQL